jgi:hypothetical protein
MIKADVYDGGSMRRVHKRVVLAMSGAITCIAILVGVLTVAVPASTAASTPPAVATGSAMRADRFGETVAGTVNPNGEATTYYFQYGPTASYGSQTTQTSAGTGTDSVNESTTVSGLTPGTLYHYRIVATNASGTTDGADQLFTADENTPTPSQVGILGREGFVSPGSVIGVELGCFEGETTCTGSFTVTHDGTVVGQRSYSLAADSGGFQNFALTAAGKQLLTQNSVHNLLPVNVNVTESDGQTLEFTVHLARWVWTG